jgi:hypothetical protein
MVGKVLERANGIAGLLREHGGVTVTYSALIQPVWMTYLAELMKITAGGMNAAYKGRAALVLATIWGGADDA